MEDLLGLARAPKMPTNLMEKLAKQHLRCQQISWRNLLNSWRDWERRIRAKNRCVLCFGRLDRWELNRPCSSYIYRGDGLNPVENLSKSIFRVSHKFGTVRIRISKARSEQLLGLSEVESEVTTRVGTPNVCWNSRCGSELLTRVRTSDSGRNSRRLSELPIAEHLLEGITSSSRLQIRRSIYIFWPSRREEHNGEVCSTFWKLHKKDNFGCQQMSPIFRWMIHEPKNN